MTKVRDLHTDDIVTHDAWNGGRPVRITRVGDAVRYQDINAHQPARQVAADDTDVTLQARKGGRR
jgi:hypothetical protein